MNKPQRYTLLPAVALAFLFLLAQPALAQDNSRNISAAQNAGSVATATDAGNKISDKTPLTLTDAEKADLANLSARYQQADQILTARLRVVLEIECASCDQDFAVKLGVDDARKYYRDVVKAAEAAYLKRLEEAQQAHDCLGCALKDGAFVRVTK